MRTVVAVTAPVVAAGPNALTQSPSARSVASALWVAATVVALVVAIFRFSVLGVVGFFVFDLVGRTKLPGERSYPVTESVDPLTLVTLPVAMAKEPRLGKRRPDPELKVGRVPPVVPPPRPPKRKPPPPGPFAPPVPPPDRNCPVHDPVVEAAATEMLRAAMVVFEDFEGVPVTVTHVPAVKEFTVSVTDLEKDVVDVQFTVVWPLLGFCTSMVEPDSAATLPVAPMGALAGAVAAPAADASVVAVTSATVPAANWAQRPRLMLRLVGVSMSNIPLLSLFGS
jgi:hypothetical protein